MVAERKIRQESFLPSPPPPQPALALWYYRTSQHPEANEVFLLLLTLSLLTLAIQI